ncbi:MAG: hypothetical protein EZS28_003230 [Streblomastix strix]|uniref:Uncharacterized protein n=1 Tax=Streblomastix strix TaxID=222440 RepID=A0A5J4X1V0_9EUKA|nr:MAG: hypothetical protein EZS28_003230 [Streblomastix strix]
MKLTPQGFLVVNNLQLLDTDFLQKIILFEQQGYQIQQQINTIIQDIGQLQADVQVKNQELTRQTYFRGYFATNDEILALQSSAVGDYAYSAEELKVWVYEDHLVETDKMVPDQVTPASDNTPLEDSAENTATCKKATANIYARSDHTHHVNLSNEAPLKDTGTGTAGSANIYASATHYHYLDVDTSSINDHVHPQQLTYYGDDTATKFIKTGGLATEVLYANGDTVNGVVDVYSQQFNIILIKFNTQQYSSSLAL